MLDKPECFRRKCQNYVGVIQPDGTEETEVNNCLAFPDGIPDDIAYGRNNHIHPVEDQGNDIVFKKEA